MNPSVASFFRSIRSIHFFVLLFLSGVFLVFDFSFMMFCC